MYKDSHLVFLHRIDSHSLHAKEVSVFDVHHREEGYSAAPQGRAGFHLARLVHSRIRAAANVVELLPKTYWHDTRKNLVAHGGVWDEVPLWNTSQPLLDPSDLEHSLFKNSKQAITSIQSELGIPRMESNRLKAIQQRLQKSSRTSRPRCASWS